VRLGATAESAGATVWLRSFGFAIDGAASSARAPAANRILVKFAFMLTTSIGVFLLRNEGVTWSFRKGSKAAAAHPPSPGISR
jgi:hypothetical protein